MNVAPETRGLESTTDDEVLCHVVGSALEDPEGIYALCGRVLGPHEPWCECEGATCRKNNLCLVCGYLMFL